MKIYLHLIYYINLGTYFSWLNTLIGLWGGLCNFDEQFIHHSFTWKGVLVAGDVPEHFQITAEVPLSKLPNPETEPMSSWAGDSYRAGKGCSTPLQQVAVMQLESFLPALLLKDASLKKKSGSHVTDLFPVWMVRVLEDRSLFMLDVGYVQFVWQ